VIEVNEVSRYGRVKAARKSGVSEADMAVMLRVASEGRSSVTDDRKKSLPAVSGLCSYRERPLSLKRIKVEMIVQRV